MKATKFLTLVFAGAMILLASCQAPISTTDASLKKTIADPAVESKRYAQNVVDALHQFQTGNSAGTIAEYFAKFPMTDADGNAISFDSLTADQQSAFLAQWQDSVSRQIEENVKDSPELLDQLKTNNDSFSTALTATAQTKGTEADFTSALNRAATAAAPSATTVVNTAGARSSSSGAGPYSLSQSAANLLASKYVKGNAITGFCDSSDSDVLHQFGHAAILTEASWNPAWLNNPDMKITISAWPQYGVFREQFSDWTNKNNWIKSIKILTPKYTYWQWTGFLVGEWRTSHPSSGDRNSAVNNAATLLGKPYNFNYLDRDNRSAYYCSQAVYRAWYDVNSNWDFHNGIWALSVTPGDLVNSGRSETTGSTNVN